MNLDRLASPIRAAAAITASLLALAAAGCGSSNPTAPKPMPPLSAVILTPPTDTLVVGQFVRFTATALDTLGAVVGDAAFSWLSSNPNVFTVDGSGQVHARSEGFALLSAAAGGHADTATVSVLFQAGWYPQVSNLSTDLNAVFFQSDRRTGWAVGNGGRIISTTDAGQTWVSQVSNSSFNLNSVYFTSQDTGWVAGTGGVILRTMNRGTSWAMVPSNASENLTHIYFATPDTGWAVGSGGLVLRTVNRGAAWLRQTPTTFNLNSVAFSGTRDGWAVGDNGTILGTHDRGLSWYNELPSITSLSLRAVSRHSATLAWASGASGVTARTVSVPDTAWTLGNAGATFTLDGLYYPSDMIGYAVGYNSGGTGVVLRTDDGGQSWQNQAINTQFRLKDVYFTDPLNGWAVGRNGQVWHTSTGGLP
ncbi:MAG: YCF48-related protein [Candidatus Eiseniibacteriota bacterium]